MSHRREYDIAFVGLKQGVHVFEYRVDDKFFLDYGEQEFTNCIADIKLTLEKNASFMQLKFDIGGTANVFCDRCGNTLSKQLWDEFTIIVKMTDEPDVMNEQEEDPDVYYISRGESHLHVADWLFEFVNLTIPFQKMCNEEEMGGSQCNNEVLEKLRKMEEEVRKDNNNPLMKGLEKFKDLDN
jgi:uncharacterized metal-binding protein YceD (DUF177 family)